MSSLAGTIALVAVSFLLPLTSDATQPAQASAEDGCPGEPGSDFCEFYHRHVAQERVRKRIVAAARKAGTEDPSGAITVRRDSTTGALTIEKWELELPDGVEARLNGYLTPRVMEHCREPGSRASVNLDLEPPVPLPHPDSADRPPEPRNEERVTRRMLKAVGKLIKAGALDKGFEVEGTFPVFVDAAGNVRRIEIEESTGSEKLDAAVIGVSEETEWRPASEYGAPTGAWFSQPIGVSMVRKDRTPP